MKKIEAPLTYAHGIKYYASSERKSTEAKKSLFVQRTYTRKFSQRWIKIFLFASVILLIAASIFINKKSEKETVINDLPDFDQALFYKGIIYAERNIYPKNYHITGGILPHHNLASFMQAGLISKIAKQKPESIIILGPNHFEKGSGKIISSDTNIKTPFGLLKTDSAFINALSSDKILEIDDQVLRSENSILSPAIYIRYFLPDVKIVPIIISHEIKNSKLKELADKLALYLKENNSVMISSVDFSHYRNFETSVKNDSETYGYITNFDYENISRLNSGYLDSPPSIISLLLVMEKLNTKKNDILLHTNSAEITNNYLSEVTSYFTVVFYE